MFLIRNFTFFFFFLLKSMLYVLLQGCTLKWQHVIQITVPLNLMCSVEIYTIYKTVSHPALVFCLCLFFFSPIFWYFINCICYMASNDMIIMNNGPRRMQKWLWPIQEVPSQYLEWLNKTMKSFRIIGLSFKILTQGLQNIK